MWRIYSIILIFLISIDLAEGANKCVWVRGAVRCRRDPTKQMNVDVRVYDRDGWSVLKMLDPDDLMGVTFTERDGTISLDGCGGDFDWFPGVPNYPDPYVVIRHNCNSEAGETLELSEFETFVPNTHDLGVIELDTPQMYHPKKKPQMEEILPKMPEFDAPKRGDLIPNSVQRTKFFKTKDIVKKPTTFAAISEEERSTISLETGTTSDAISEEERSTISLETDIVVSLETDSIDNYATTQTTVDAREKEKYMITHPDTEAVQESKPDLIQLKNIQK